MYTTMESAIERLNRLIHTTVEKIKTETVNLETIRDHSSEVKAELKSYLLNSSQAVKTERELEILVQECQAEIITLLDQLNALIEIFKISSQLQILEVLRNDLRDTLTYIENRYSKYFNLNERVPTCYLKLIQSDLQKATRRIKRYLNNAVGKAELFDILEAPVKSLVRRRATFKELIYLKNLYSTSEDLISRGMQQYAEQDIYDFLVYMNFNSYGFITYYINMISVEVNALHDSLARVERLSYHLKRINQMHVKPGVALREKVVSVKEQVSNWISEELYFIEKKQRLLTITPTFRDEAVIVDEEKLHLSVSVEVLTLLARAAKDSKLILNQQMTSMFKSISRFCRTVHTENPSAHSMLKKSYVAERGSKDTAINLMHEMIKHLHRY